MFYEYQCVMFNCLRLPVVVNAPVVGSIACAWRYAWAGKICSRAQEGFQEAGTKAQKKDGKKRAQPHESLFHLRVQSANRCTRTPASRPKPWASSRTHLSTTSSSAYSQVAPALSPLQQALNHHFLGDPTVGDRCCPASLAKHAHVRGTKAVTKYTSSKWVPVGLAPHELPSHLTF